MVKISWKSVEETLGIEEGPGSDREDEYLPEPIVHELAHAYLCIGEKAFSYVGRQKEVSKLIDDTFAQEGSIPYDMHEIATTALTFLVLQPLGLADLTNQLVLMRKNLGHEIRERYSVDGTNRLFLDCVADFVMVRHGIKIREFLSTFAQEDEHV